MVMVAGVRFKRASKVYDFDSTGVELKGGEMVIVEVEKGMGMGTVVSEPREVDPSTLQRKLKKVIRVADDVDMERHGFNTEREEEAYHVCKAKIAEHKLPMKLVNVEYLFDSSKAIFYFTSDSRVDFRELVKDLASDFHTRIEMRQIGVRDEAKMLGGIGPCGRELCCSGFLSNFEPVTIKMAKEQNLALNPTKISGICGRLMCCLSYEYGMYKEERLRRKAAAKHGGQPGKAADGCGSCDRHGEPGAHGADRPDMAAEGADRRPEDSGKRPPRAGRDRRLTEASEGAPPIGQEAPAPMGPQESATEAARAEGNEGGGEGGEGRSKRRSKRGRRRRGRSKSRPGGQAGQGPQGSQGPPSGGGSGGQGGQ